MDDRNRGAARCSRSKVDGDEAIHRKLIDDISAEIIRHGGAVADDRHHGDLNVAVDDGKLHNTDDAADSLEAAVATGAADEYAGSASHHAKSD